MNTVTALVYWVIIAIWLTVFVTLATFYATNRRSFGTTRLLLAVIALDTTRNILENSYFGVYFGSLYGLFPQTIGHVLGNPYLLILPKLANVVAGCIVLVVLLMKWLPEAIRERADSDRQAEYLHRLATTDEMTGLKNRREFMALAEVEWQRTERYERPLSLLMLDIDDFKSINDRFGHSIGDEVIVAVGQLCGREKRISDIPGRIGGEEFAIILPEVGAAGAQAYADRLCKLISNKVISADGVDIAVTVSIGTSVSTDCESMLEFLKQADTALYEAKRTGRNRVCSFVPKDKTGLTLVRT